MAKFACSFFVTTVLILCTVTVICTAAPVIRLGSTGGSGANNSSRRGSMEGLSRKLSNQSRERHRIANQYFSSNDKPEWHNPCGGVFQPNGEPPQRKPDLDLTLFKMLKIPVSRTVNTINHVRGDDYHQLTHWVKWEASYTFLPSLNHSQSSMQMSASIPHIKRRPQLWHRDIQVYVAAFQYLHKKQLPEVIDINNGTTASEQLVQLMDSAKSLLCEIETLINGTTGNLRKPRSRIEMGNILKYNTSSNVSSSTSFLDREFTKQRYLHYVTDLYRLLERKIERMEREKDKNRRNGGFNSNNSMRNSRRRSNESRRRRRPSAEENLTREQLRRHGRKQRRHRNASMPARTGTTTRT